MHMWAYIKEKQADTGHSIKLFDGAVKHKDWQALRVLVSVLNIWRSSNTGVYYFCGSRVQRSCQPGPYGNKKVLRQKNLSRVWQQFCKLQMSNNVSCDFCWTEFLPNIVRRCLQKRQQELRQDDITVPHFPLASLLLWHTGQDPDLRWPPRPSSSFTNKDVTGSDNSDLLPPTQ